MALVVVGYWVFFEGYVNDCQLRAIHAIFGYYDQNDVIEFDVELRYEQLDIARFSKARCRA